MQQKKTESLENIIVESLPYAVITADRAGRIISFNNAAETMTEVSRTVALGKTISEMFPRDRWLIELYSSTLNEGKLVSSFKSALQRRFSPPLFVSISTCSLTDDSGASTGVILIIRDISSIKPLENEEKVDAGIERLDAFASTLAHEIRNPLGGIRGTAELLSRKAKDEKTKQYASVIIEASDRLNDTVTRMLGLNRGSSEKKKSVNIHKTVDSAVSLFESELKDIRFTRDYDPSLPPVNGIEGALSQVFTNLVKNAVEALKGKKEALVTVSTRMATEFHLIESGSKEKKFVEVEVRDNGPGIQPEDLESVFTPFFTTKRGGSGLGLGVSYKIIKEHGGFLRIESVPKTGTKVRVYLPAKIKK